MPEESKTYVPKVSAKQIKFQSGKSIIKLGIHADTMIEFLKTHRNEKGYVNLGISERKQPSQYGDTHSVWLDTWKPGERPSEPRSVMPKSSVDKSPTESEDCPF